MEGPGKTRAVINDPSSRQSRLHVRLSDSTLEHALQDVETKRLSKNFLLIFKQNLL
jgi:hypothetical protein